jgi:hypothetical protein
MCADHHPLWSNAMKNQTGLSPSAMPSLPIGADGQKALAAAARLQMQAFSATIRYQIELLSFLKHRCEQDLKLVEDLVASDESSDAFDVVANFVQSATSAYATEAARIASLCSRMASETAKHIRYQAETTIGDMAAQTVA